MTYRRDDSDDSDDMVILDGHSAESSIGFHIFHGISHVKHVKSPTADIFRTKNRGANGSGLNSDP